jgi:DNA-binding transcriptional ArsR family regulator
LQSLYTPTIVSRRLRPRGEEEINMIMSVIESHAGIRYSELARKTKMAHGTLSHHIKMLLRQKKIRVRRDKQSTWFFPDSYDEELCNAVASASHPTTMAVMALLLRQECNFKQIENIIMKSSSTVSEHLKRLLSVGLVARRRVDRISIYRIADADKAMMIMNNRRYGSWQ